MSYIPIFISHCPEDKRYAEKIRQWAKRQKFGDYYVHIQTSQDIFLRNANNYGVPHNLKKAYLNAHFIIVLVGNRSHAHPWQAHEMFAQQHELRRYYMRIPYTNSPLPNIMQHLQQIAYNPNAIDKLLRTEPAYIAKQVSIDLSRKRPKVIMTRKKIVRLPQRDAPPHQPS